MYNAFNEIPEEAWELAFQLIAVYGKYGITHSREWFEEHKSSRERQNLFERFNKQRNGRILGASLTRFSAKYNALPGVLAAYFPVARSNDQLTVFAVPRFVVSQYYYLKAIHDFLDSADFENIEPDASLRGEILSLFTSEADSTFVKKLIDHHRPFFVHQEWQMSSYDFTFPWNSACKGTYFLVKNSKLITHEDNDFDLTNRIRGIQDTMVLISTKQADEIQQKWTLALKDLIERSDTDISKTIPCICYPPL